MKYNNQMLGEIIIFNSVVLIGYILLSSLI